MRATDKQKEYAKAIAEMLGCSLPKEDDKQAYSAFIDAHVSEFNGMKEEYELKAEYYASLND